MTPPPALALVAWLLMAGGAALALVAGSRERPGDRAAWLLTAAYAGPLALVAARTTAVTGRRASVRTYAAAATGAAVAAVATATVALPAVAEAGLTQAATYLTGALPTLAGTDLDRATLAALLVDVAPGVGLLGALTVALTRLVGATPAQVAFWAALALALAVGLPLVLAADAVTDRLDATRRLTGVLGRDRRTGGGRRES